MRPWNLDGAFVSLEKFPTHISHNPYGYQVPAKQKCVVEENQNKLLK